jgi:ketopantoate reductase
MRIAVIGSGGVGGFFGAKQLRFKRAARLDRR